MIAAVSSGAIEGFAIAAVWAVVIGVSAWRIEREDRARREEKR